MIAGIKIHDDQSKALVDNEPSSKWGPLCESYYVIVVELWKNFCEKHSNLFNVTCDEYSVLLASEIDALEKILEAKEKIIEDIKRLEERRTNIILNINSDLKTHRIQETDSINSVSGLIIFFQEYEKSNGNHYLRKFNELLVDIIEKIQIQNKRNQMFLNKSIKSLRDIKEGLMGKKVYQTYNSQGVPQNNITR